MGLVFATLRRLLGRSSLLTLALFLPFVATSFFMKLGPPENRYSPASLFSLFPIRYGGQGYDYIMLALACEELERVDTTLRVIMSVHMGLNSMALLQWGTEEQKQRFLVPQAKGEKYGAFCLTEPGAGSDLAGVRSTCTRDGDTYVLNGQKIWSSRAVFADWAFGLFREPGSERHKGMSLILFPLDAPGVTRREHET